MFVGSVVHDKQHFPSLCLSGSVVGPAALQGTSGQPVSLRVGAQVGLVTLGQHPRGLHCLVPHSCRTKQVWVSSLRS